MGSDIGKSCAERISEIWVISRPQRYSLGPHATANRALTLGFRSILQDVRNRETGWWSGRDLNPRPLPQSLRGKFSATLAEYSGWETGRSAAERDHQKRGRALESY